MTMAATTQKPNIRVPYAMTEEFTAVYRMHSLIPDDFSFRRPADNHEVFKGDMNDVAGGAVHELYAKLRFDEVVYSLATSHNAFTSP